MSVQQQLREILEKQSFEDLAPFTDPGSWKAMTSEERELLAILFVKQGKAQLSKGDKEAAKSFKRAEKVAPKSPMVYYSQAVAYAAQDDERSLNQALKALEIAVELDDCFINAWHSLGNVNARLGTITGKSHYFYSSDSAFQFTFDLAKEAKEEYQAILCCHWGSLWYEIAKQSGEPSDYVRAVELFRFSQSKGLESGEFYNTFGRTLRDMGHLLDREDLMEEAKGHFLKAVTLSPEVSLWQFDVACICQELFEDTGNVDLFSESCDHFERTIDLDPDSEIVWCRYGELYSLAGRLSRSAELIEMALKKFERAHEVNPVASFVILRWVESLLNLFSLTEKLEFLNEALKKSISLVRIAPDSPDAWALNGECQLEYGRYFSSKEHFEQAIRILDCGLEKHPTAISILSNLTFACFSYGDLTNDSSFIEKSLNLFYRLSTLHEEPPPQFYCDWGITLMKLGEMTRDKNPIELAIEKFEKAISSKLEEDSGEEVDPNWLYNYGCAFDFLGDFYEDPMYYDKAIHVLTHVVQTDPEHFPARFNLAIAFTHLGELSSDPQMFYKAVDQYHFLVHREPEDEMLWNDYGVCLLNLAVITSDPILGKVNKTMYDQAESKLLHAASLGNQGAYYNLGCLYALLNNFEAAMYYLEKGEQCDVLPPLEDILHDEWLENLRNYPPYRSFISRLLNSQEEEDN